MTIQTFIQRSVFALIIAAAPSCFVYCATDHARLLSVSECDELITQSGDLMMVKVLEIGASEIRYKKCEYLDGPAYVIEKNKVFMIIYPNGTKDVFPKIEPSEPSTQDNGASREGDSQGQVESGAEAGIPPIQSNQASTSESPGEFSFYIKPFARLGLAHAYGAEVGNGIGDRFGEVFRILTNENYSSDARRRLLSYPFGLAYGLSWEVGERSVVCAELGCLRYNTQLYSIPELLGFARRWTIASRLGYMRSFLANRKLLIGGGVFYERLITLRTPRGESTTITDENGTALRDTENYFDLEDLFYWSHRIQRNTIGVELSFEYKLSLGSNSHLVPGFNFGLLIQPNLGYSSEFVQRWDYDDHPIRWLYGGPSLRYVIDL